MDNELLRDLARRAGLFAPYGSDREGLAEFNWRLFAELLIRDCAAFADRYNREMYGKAWTDSSAILTRYGIEEHHNEQD